MKKIVFAVALFAIMGPVAAQEPADALRYSWSIPGGTARSQAIGGAMGSLGGDITTTFTNPAGLALYRTGDIIFSPAYQFGKTKASYLGTGLDSNFNKFSWGTTGFVIGNANRWNNERNVAFSIAYNRAADFNSNIQYRGLNTKSSFAQQYLEEIGLNNTNSNDVSNNYGYGPSLAYNTFYIDSMHGAGNQVSFFSRASRLLSTGLLQQNTIKSSGGIDEIAFAGAAQVSKKVMLGGTLGINLLHYKRSSEFVEADATNNTTNGFDYAQVNENLTTSGVGVNLRMGLIYKPQDYWRLGLAFHTPTLYQLTDQRYVAITTNAERPGTGTLTDNSSNNYPNVGDFKYQFSNPYRLIGSVAYVLRETADVTKQKGFITADIEYVNYKAATYKQTTDNNYASDAGTVAYLKSLNKAIDNSYKGSFNFRAGGELKFTTFMVRAGAAYYGNPYKNINGEKGSKLNLSGGLGYRNKGFFLTNRPLFRR
jgi:hypothetical protein